MINGGAVVVVAIIALATEARRHEKAFDVSVALPTGLAKQFIQLRTEIGFRPVFRFGSQFV